MKRSIRNLWIGFIGVFSLSILFAYDNETTHPILTISGNNLLTSSQRPTYLPGYDEIKNFGFEIRTGSFNEDAAPRWLNHFYNPYNPPNHEPLWGFLPGVVNAKEWAKHIWEESIAKFNQNEKSEAYEKLGRVAHLLEDMASAPHVHNDGHLFGSDYEEWAEANTSLTVNWIGNLIEPVDSYEDAMHDMAVYTFDATKIVGQLVRNTADPVNGDLAKMFPEVAHLTYIPVGGADPETGTNTSVEFWWIANVGKYQPELFPIRNNDWWKTQSIAGNPDPLVGYFYIENVRNAIAQDYRSTPQTGAWTGTAKLLSRIWAEDYRLIARNTEFVAGLLKFFHDVVNFPVYVESVRFSQSGENKYVAEWSSGTTNRTLSIPTVKPVKPTEAGNIKIEFSEPVKEVSISVGTHSITGSFVSGTEDKEWQGDIPTTVLSSLQIGTSHQIKIYCLDKNNHYYNRTSSGAVIDGNPETIAKADANSSTYEWTGYEAII